MSSSELIYETETMAELCARQGRMGEAIAIYRRLYETTQDPSLKGRCHARLTVLESGFQPLREIAAPAADIPIPAAPGVAVSLGDDQLTLAWAISPDLPSPALEVLVIERNERGIETQKKTLPLDRASGRLGLIARGAHSAVAAVGSIVEGRFVPLARSRAGG